MVKLLDLGQVVLAFLLIWTSLVDCLNLSRSHPTVPNQHKMIILLCFFSLWPWIRHATGAIWAPQPSFADSHKFAIVSAVPYHTEGVCSFSVLAEIHGQCLMLRFNFLKCTTQW